METSKLQRRASVSNVLTTNDNWLWYFPRNRRTTCDENAGKRYGCDRFLVSLWNDGNCTAGNCVSCCLCNLKWFANITYRSFHCSLCLTIITLWGSGSIYICYYKICLFMKNFPGWNLVDLNYTVHRFNFYLDFYLGNRNNAWRQLLRARNSLPPTPPVRDISREYVPYSSWTVCGLARVVRRGLRFIFLIP